MDVETYYQLNRLPSVTNESAVTNFSALIQPRVTTSSDLCTEGTILPLWAANSNVSWTACVQTASRYKYLDSSWSPFVVAAVAVGAAAVVAGAFALFYRHRQKAWQAAHDTTDGLIDELDILEPVRIPAANVALVEKLGEGAFGEIWRGSHLGRAVAIKKLLPQRTSAADIRSFINELVLMTRFQCLQIVALYGVSWTRPKDMMAVLELMDLGDLRGFLAMRPQ
ncbi:hypothetical protein ACHHYP_06669, partial [Achlya hypogyna]